MKMKRLICALCCMALCLSMACCKAQETPAAPETVKLTIKTTPISLGNVPGVGEAEIYDFFVAASEKFKAQYDKYEVEFAISRYNYLDEQEQLADKYGTAEAADIYYSGSWNTPSYACLLYTSTWRNKKITRMERVTARFSRATP